MWVLTYADMITVLMGFFVVMSTMNKEEKKEQLVTELVSEFGTPEAMRRHLEGATRRRDAREKAQGNDKLIRGRSGNDRKVMTIRDGDRLTIGGPVFFSQYSTTLNERSQSALSKIADSLRGKPHLIEVRAYRPTNANASLDDLNALAIKRANVVADFLVRQGRLHRDIIRVSLAAPIEGSTLPSDEEDTGFHDRVDVTIFESSRNDFQNDRLLK